jgi:predicted double-glycine peptidase
MISRILVGMLLLMVSCREGEAGTIYAPAAFLGDVAVKVTSLKELKFRRTVQQKYDFSCGSAALATLLTYHYEDRVPEAEIFMAMYNAGDKEKIRREGFSLLDMKNYLQRRGYQSDGFKINLDKVRQVGVPALVLISNHGYKHFVVLKGVSARTVLLGDPALGARVMTRKEFETCWNGLVFLVRSHKEVAVRHFNQAADWPSSGQMTNFVPMVSDRLLSPTLYMSIIGGH